MSQCASQAVDPPEAISVSIEGRDGRAVARGFVAGISSRGGCIWSDVCLTEGTTLRFRLSFNRFEEVHAVDGRVLWARTDPQCSLDKAHCSVIRWIGVNGLRRRLPRLIA